MFVAAEEVPAHEGDRRRNAQKDNAVNVGDFADRKNRPDARNAVARVDPPSRSGLFIKRATEAVHLDLNVALTFEFNVRPGPIFQLRERSLDDGHSNIVRHGPFCMIDQVSVSRTVGDHKTIVAFKKKDS
jgi:hypothetical protein